RAALYTKLLAAAGSGAGAVSGQLSSQPIAGSRSNGNGPSHKNGAAGPPPRHWDDIVVGYVLIAQEGPGEGWYDAIVVELAGDISRVLPQRCLPTPRVDRRVEVSGRHRSAVVCQKGRIRCTLNDPGARWSSPMTVSLVQSLSEPSGAITSNVIRIH